MNELMRSDWNWILYDEEGILHLRVLCNGNSWRQAGYILDPEESRRVYLEGASFLEELARTIARAPDDIPEEKRWAV